MIHRKDAQAEALRAVARLALTATAFTTASVGCNPAPPVVQAPVVSGNN